MPLLAFFDANFDFLLVNYNPFRRFSRFEFFLYFPMNLNDVIVDDIPSSSRPVIRTKTNPIVVRLQTVDRVTYIVQPEHTPNILIEVDRIIKNPHA